MAGELRYSMDGIKLKLGEIDPDIDVDAFLDVKAGLIKMYSDRSTFIKAAKAAGISDKIDKAIVSLDKARKEYQGMSAAKMDTIKVEQIKEFDGKQKNVKALLKKKGVSPYDEKALLKLHKNGEIGSMLVYEHAGCVGDWAYFPPGFYPKLSWFGWNDRISSFYNLGLLASLHQHTWFCGKTLWVPMFVRYSQLGWWNDRISSMIFYG